jgi:thiamine pyrophosphate-dependent acetolactate synthase large subunit-like protein
VTKVVDCLYCVFRCNVGVCFATSGPGATNLAGIANARMDSIPMIIITGQVGRFYRNRCFSRDRYFGITLPIVKHSYTVRETHLLPKILAEAFFLKTVGRPVLIDIPKDVGLEETVEYSYQKIADLFKKIITVQNITLNEKIDQFVETVNDCFLPLYVEEVLFVRMV